MCNLVTLQLKYSSAMYLGKKPLPFNKFCTFLSNAHYSTDLKSILLSVWWLLREQKSNQPKPVALFFTGRLLSSLEQKLKRKLTAPGQEESITFHLFRHTETLPPRKTKLNRVELHRDLINVVNHIASCPKINKCLICLFSKCKIHIFNMHL